MKNGLLSMALILGLAAIPSALRAEGQRLEHLTQSLSLTTDQQGKVKAILDAQKKKMEELGSQMKASRDKADSDIEAILTPDQKTKYAEVKAKRHERMEGRHEKRKDSNNGEQPNKPE